MMLNVDGKKIAIPDNQIDEYKKAYGYKILELQNEYNKKIEEAKALQAQLEEYMKLCNAIVEYEKEDEITPRM